MIITESKPYGIIKALLTKEDKIGIVGCNACARVCETGSEEKVKELKERLEKDGFKVVDTDCIPMACDIDLVKKPTYEGEVLIALTCDAGVYSLKKLFPNKKIIEALDTVGLGARDESGNIFLVKKF